MEQTRAGIMQNPTEVDTNTNLFNKSQNDDDDDIYAYGIMCILEHHVRYMGKTKTHELVDGWIGRWIGG